MLVWADETSNRFMERELDLSSSILRNCPCFSSRFKHGDDNRGSDAIRRHFDSHCEVTLSIASAHNFFFNARAS